MILMARCFKCQDAAVVHVAYTKQDVCRSCFCSQFESRVRKANYDFSLLLRSDVIAVGISGGKDSACLLYNLHLLSKEIGFQLTPILIDEGIAGYRNKAAAKAEELCEQLSLPLHTFSYKDSFGLSMDELMLKRNEKRKEDASFGRPSCGYCGVFRKNSLNKAARELGCSKLAIGHNADDVAQTFLMNLLRGEKSGNERFGVAVDAGIAGFVPRIKPLIYNLELECAQYALLKELPFHLGECPYSNEAYRGVVKDFLNDAEEKYPGTKFNLLSSFLSLHKKLSGKAVEEEKAHVATVACPTCGESYSGSNATCKACSFVKEFSQSAARN